MSNTPLNWSWNLNKCCPRWCFYWTWSLWVWCYSQESGGEIWVDGGQIWLGFRLRSFQQIYCRKGMQWKLAIDLDFSWGVGLTPSHQYIEWILYRILNNKFQKTLQLAWAPPCRWNSRSSSKTCSSPSFFFWHWESPRKSTEWSWLIDSQQWFSHVFAMRLHGFRDGHLLSGELAGWRHSADLLGSVARPARLPALTWIKSALWEASLWESVQLQVPSIRVKPVDWTTQTRQTSNMLKYHWRI